MKSPPLLVTLQRYWLFALLLVVPLSLQYIVYQPFAISSLNLLSVGFIGLGIINMVLGFLPIKPLKHTPFALLILLLLVVFVYALFYTHPLRNGVGLWTSRLLQPLLVGWFVYQLMENKYLKAQECIKMLFWSLVPLLILGAMQLAGHLPYRNPGRITASYEFPNTFARYVAIVLVVSLPWIVWGLRRYRRMYLGIWLLGVVLLLSSKSYGGTAAFFTSMVVVFLLLPRSFSRLKQIVVGTLVIIALLVAGNASKLPKWQTSIQESRLSRLEFWDIALGAIRDNYWTGIGIKSWETRYVKLIEQYGAIPPRNWSSAQPHNVFLDSFLKAGLPGFIAITSLLLWPLLEGACLIKSYAVRYKEWWYGLSMAGYGTLMLTFGLIDDPIWSDDTMPLLFILLFILAALIPRAQPAAKRDA